MFFTKKWREKKQAEREANALAKRKEDAKPEVQQFIAWYKQQTVGKKDKDINFVKFGYEAHNLYFKLFTKYSDLLQNCQPISVPASERCYSWLNSDCSWYNWNYSKMYNHYTAFINQERAKQLYGDYSLEKTGPHGGGIGFPYDTCAYLSYAYYEKKRWQKCISLLKEEFCL